MKKLSFKELMQISYDEVTILRKDGGKLYSFCSNSKGTKKNVIHLTMGTVEICIEEKKMRN